MKKPSLLVIFLTVFLDLIGFGIVLPLLPVFAKTLEASGLVIGLLMASFSAMQFIFAPVWGRLSDRIGRRPVLLVSTAGSAISYAIFAVGSGQAGQTAIVLLFLSRAFAGICGANITVAQAYIADITPPEERSKKMGLVGMAFGLGFIFGPALGGLGMKFGGVTAPGWIAAALCGANFLFAFARLPESWQPGANAAAQRPRWLQMKHTLQRPGIALLVLVFFLATFSFACFETTLGLLVSLNFGLKFETIKGVVHTFDDKVVYLYTFCGLVGALVQGGPLGRAVKKFGEPTLIALSLGLVAVSLGMLPFVKTWPLLLGALAMLAIGSSLTRPPVFGMLSQLAPADEQGATLGVAQSAGSLARIFGPIFAATLFDVHPSWPYLACAVVSLLAGFLAWSKLHHAVKKPQ
ncbi:MAG: MFS transporter [Verrucomicrobia bacterium]|nr:MFS transporter [Verrucomicrobiota bacterium]NBU08214.1 MFS transporter [Pseudomonadota bacterium]NDB76952.1 MFS transporter [Verrucomicrobiota bacterium]NDD39926.1 MFS transporter [Verrucomicrobiota bacterium]